MPCWAGPHEATTHRGRRRRVRRGCDGGGGRRTNGTTMWVVGDQDDKFYAYNISTGTRRSDLDIDELSDEGNNDPTDIWSNGKIMWVLDNEDDLVYAYDLPTPVGGL